MDSINVECEPLDMYQCGDGKGLRMCKVDPFGFIRGKEWHAICLLANFSSHLWNDIQGREDIASFPDPSQLFITHSTASDKKLCGAWDEAREDMYVTMEINET